MNILNIAGGKIKPLEIPTDSSFAKRVGRNIVNVDFSYFDSIPPNIVEKTIRERRLGLGDVREFYCGHDIIKFMERTTITFDQVAIYRFLEHVTFTDINYFIYLVSTIIKPGGIVDVIVPNYNVLADMILEDDPYSDTNFEASNILLTTELLNEPSCPHASIWTPLRALYFWELEGRFEVPEENIESRFKFDGRDIYLRFFAKRL
jgi:hypothetical protein